MKKNEKIILFGKPTHWFETVEQFLLENSEDVRIYTGDWGDKFPEVEEKISDDGKHYKIPIDFSCDYLISFCCPWIFKKKVLNDGLLKEIRARGAYEKPSVKRRRKRKEARRRLLKTLSMRKKLEGY